MGTSASNLAPAGMADQGLDVSARGSGALQHARAGQKHLGSKPVKVSFILALFQLPDRLACSGCVNFMQVQTPGSDTQPASAPSPLGAYLGQVHRPLLHSSENTLPCCHLYMVDVLCILQMISLQCGVLSFAESACQSEGSCKVELTALLADCLASTTLLPSGCQALQTILACNGEHHGDSRNQLWLNCTHSLLCILSVCAGSCQWYRWSCQGTLCPFMFR